jgi:L-seryl-tRNA(Ser) seleniumtransferase
LQRGQPAALTVGVAREVLEAARRRIAAGEPAPSEEDVVDEVEKRVLEERRSPLGALINATGVILHTNLGRAPLSHDAIEAMTAAVAGYSNLEFDLESGARGSRHTILEPLLRRVTGAEAAMAVNNNAAAVLLALAALASGKEVVVSRGQLVEIGGGFRIPDVMRQSRAKLVEVGTTNRSRVSDYEAAIGPKTAALMRVHPSNFRMSGFTESASIEELAELARIRGILLIDDVGSGCLLDTTRFGLEPEPTPQASIAAGADIVMFSGDKLLGGPQGGLIAGRRAPIEKMKRHPLARAMRLDKASIAGLAATLRTYVEGTAEENIPVWQMITMPLDELDRRASEIARRVGRGAEVMDGRSMIGGGSLPEEGLPSRVVALAGGGRGAASLARELRRRGIVSRVEAGKLLLDLRTVDPAEDARLGDECAAVLGR